MRITLTVVVGALALALAGCTPGPGPLPIPPSPTATPVFASDEEALEAAVGLYKRYAELSTSLSTEQKAIGPELEEVLGGELLESERAAAEEWLDQGYSVQGALTFDHQMLQRFSSEGSVASVVFYVCQDVSGTRLFDSSGSDITPENRRDRLPLEVEAAGASRNDFRLIRSDLWSGDDFC